MPALGDYFAFLGLPEKLDMDLSELERQYYRLSKVFHPDYYRKAGAQEQDLALENMSFLTRACRALKDPRARAEYVLSRAGRKVADGGLGGAAPASGEGRHKEGGQVSKELLLELFELHELCERAEVGSPSQRQAMRSELAEARSEILERQSALARKREALFRKWDACGRDEGCRKAALDELEQEVRDEHYLERTFNHLEEVLSLETP